jgi:hypothetical protein
MTPKRNPLSSAFIGKLLLAFCLLGLAAATARASIVFQVSGTLNDGSAISGTFTIDTTAGTVTAANLTLGPPTSETCNSIANQFVAGGGPGFYELDLNCSAGNKFIVFLPSDPAGDLLGYTGGSIAGGSFLTGTETNVAAATVSQGGFFQVRYASNLITGGDAVIDITNTGSSASAVNCSPGRGCVGPDQNNINGNVCVNIYTFSADEQEVACCSCLVTPNALWSASVKTALLNSTLTPSFPNEVVIKLISSAPHQKTVDTVTTQSCNPATLLDPAALIEPGVMAWGTSTHGFPTSTGPTFQLTETPFLPSTLSPAELTRDVQECQFIQILGSGQFGICKGCSNVGLGAAAQ